VPSDRVPINFQIRSQSDPCEAFRGERHLVKLNRIVFFRPARNPDCLCAVTHPPRPSGTSTLRP